MLHPENHSFEHQIDSIEAKNPPHQLYHLYHIVPIPLIVQNLIRTPMIAMSDASIMRNPNNKAFVSWLDTNHPTCISHLPLISH